MILLFAVIAVILDNASGQKSGIVMLLLFPLTAVIAYIFSIGTACGCCTCDKGFVQMFVLST